MCGFNNITTSDIISIIGIIVNSILALWIVFTIQKNIDNKRVLKDFLISEVRSLKTDYSNLLNNLQKGVLRPRRVNATFKLLNIKTQNIMEITSTKCKINEGYLKPYQTELRTLITELDEYVSSFKNDDLIDLKAESMNKLIVFQQANSKFFNNLIVEINSK